MDTVAPKQSAEKLPPMALAALEHERLTSLISSMADGVIAIDDHNKIVLYNGAALNILDINGSVTGRLIQRVMSLYDKNGQNVHVEELIANTTIPTSNRDYLLHYSDGSKVNLYLSIAPVYLGYGAKGERGFVLLLRDITREKSLEEERDEFISVVSHELRTPIAITEGNISNAQFVAKKSGNILEIQKALDGAHEQILFLAGLVNDLSTLSRAERNVLAVDIEAINPHALVQDLVDSNLEQAKDKSLTLRAELDPNLEVLASSKLYTREILQNFVTNAIKYTEQGTVTIGATKSSTGVRFTIADTGIGISKSDQEMIFDKFFRSEDYRTRLHSGTGLGLYVTRKLALLIHAEITIESELNHGSIFTITIPNLK